MKLYAASNGKAAVAMTMFGGKPVLYKYAPSAVGKPARRAELDDLVDRALAKMGWKIDKRCAGGVREVRA